MSSAAKEKWDRIYQTANVSPAIIAVLKEYAFLLPEAGRALDLACGLGENACFLADKGLSVDAWDISSVAIQHLEKRVNLLKLPVYPSRCAIEANLITKNLYDVILVSRYLDRELTQAIMEALKPSGLLFYQTFTRQKTVLAGPNNPDYLLSENELLHLFSGLSVLHYRELGVTGDTTQGLRDEAQLVARKRGYG